MEKIHVDLTNWSTSSPCGIIAYKDSKAIYSEYCDDTGDFLSFLNDHSDQIGLTTDLTFEIKADDMTCIAQPVKEISEHFELIKEDM